jgi:hypothetical protein
MGSLSDLAARSTPLEREKRLVVDGALIARIDQLRAELKAAKRRDIQSGSGLRQEAPAIESALTEAEIEADESAETFRFRAIGRGKFTRIIEQYPPTKQQWERYKEQVRAHVGDFTRHVNPPEYDPDALAPALLAACCVSHEGTTDEWIKLRDETFSDGQWAELFEAALMVNMEATLRPTFGNGTDSTPNTVSELISPANGASPTPFSQDG